MNKIIIFILSAVFYVSGFATTVGNPLNPEIIEEGFFISPTSWINFRVGYEGDFISDARLYNALQKGKIDNFKKDINSGTLTLNFQNRMDVFGVVGEGRIRSDWRFENLNAVSRLQLESNYRLYWAAGAKVILFQWCNTALSTGGRYTFMKPSISYITIDGIPQDKGNSRIKSKDWQIDLGLAHRIDLFIPFIGVKYLNAKERVYDSPVVISADNQNYVNMKNKDRFGIYAGCSLSNSKYFMLTVEARFIDEEAISVSGDLKF
ncbi:MAG: hypothetical protein WCT85_04925 [Parachlamydiales bacterium]|jgi:hypothetical protein